ncbi:hypothetical protein EMIT07CA2_550133 [Brevibacillus sp. IT-7CA2]|uniref:hypothetical protein n=1 Tax=Brevibacillus sp. IT-7CA2 TaxID=3026436 RepID=UPI0039DFEFD7
MNIRVIKPNLVSITLSTKELIQFDLSKIGDLQDDLKFHCLLKFILAQAEQLGAILQVPFAIAALNLEDGIQMEFCLKDPVEYTAKRSEVKKHPDQSHTFVFWDYTEVMIVEIFNNPPSLAIEAKGEN